MKKVSKCLLYIWDPKLRIGFRFIAVDQAQGTLTENTINLLNPTACGHQSCDWKVYWPTKAILKVTYKIADFNVLLYLMKW